MQVNVKAPNNTRRIIAAGMDVSSLVGIELHNTGMVHLFLCRILGRISFGPRKTEKRMAFAITSNSFKDGDYLGSDHILSADFGFGCAGGNKSPHLAWSGAPAGAKSFAVTCFDPDAPTGSGFWHWLVVNIPANVTELPLDAGNAKAGRLPAGALQTRTDFGAPGYGGPCPPAGDHPHRYLFTVFAVNKDKLEVTADTSAAVIGFQLNFSTLAKAAIMGLYKRQ
jgi:Raf kinase inhibitor-like YbhB/YbcL family protein